MSRSAGGMLFWAPRVLTLLFALFLSLFAIDVFSEAGSLTEILVGLASHLVPTFIVVAVLVLAWRWEWVGAIAFAGLAVAYVVVMWGRFPWVTYATVSGPLLLVSVLFFLSWRQRIRTGRAATQSPAAGAA